MWRKEMKRANQTASALKSSLPILSSISHQQCANNAFTGNRQLLYFDPAVAFCWHVGDFLLSLYSKFVHPFSKFWRGIFSVLNLAFMFLKFADFTYRCLPLRTRAAYRYFWLLKRISYPPAKKAPRMRRSRRRLRLASAPLAPVDQRLTLTLTFFAKSGSGERACIFSGLDITGRQQATQQAGLGRCLCIWLIALRLADFENRDCVMIYHRQQFNE